MEMTEAQAAEICMVNNMTEIEVWTLYVNAFTELRTTKICSQAIYQAIFKVGDRLKLTLRESMRLYDHLRQKMVVINPAQ